MSTFNLDLTTQQIVAEFYIEGTTGGPAVGNIAVLNLDGNVSHVLRGDGTWGAGGNGGGGGGNANVAGANGQLQYNNGGNLGAVTGVSTDGVKLSVASIANFKISGGSNGQMITTDGSGNLSFSTVPGYVNVPRVELKSPNVITTNPTFTNSTFAYYANAQQMNIFESGVLSDKDFWSLSGTTLSYTGTLLPDTQIDILPQAVAIGNTNMSGNINADIVTANAFIGDGSNLTNLPGGSFISNTTTKVETFSTGNVKVTVDGADMMNIDTAGAELSGNFVPTANITYDLGSPTRRWRDLYLSNNTINLGDTSLSASNGNLTIGGEIALTAPGGVLTVDSVVANAVQGSGANLSNIAGGNITGQVASAYEAEFSNIANVANLVEFSNIANIGNISAVDLDGNVSNVLVGDGTWTKIGNIASIDLDGNVSNVLTGNGTYTKLGNIASIDLNGNTSQVFTGNGTFSSTIPTDQANTQILFSDGANITSSANLNYNGTILKVFNGTISSYSNTTPFVGIRYSSDTVGSTLSLSKARGTRGSATAVQVGDDLFTTSMFAYTGNGTTTLDGASGWASLASPLTANVTALPTTSGGKVSTSVRISASDATSNANPVVATFNSSQETTLFGNLIINNGTTNHATKYVPATATSAGIGGQITYDASYIYICVGVNTWKRVAVAAW